MLWMHPLPEEVHKPQTAWKWKFIAGKELGCICPVLYVFPKVLLLPVVRRQQTDTTLAWFSMGMIIFNAIRNTCFWFTVSPQLNNFHTLKCLLFSLPQSPQINHWFYFFYFRNSFSCIFLIFILWSSETLAHIPGW